MKHLTITLHLGIMTFLCAEAAIHSLNSRIEKAVDGLLKALQGSMEYQELRRDSLATRPPSLSPSERWDRAIAAAEDEIRRVGGAMELGSKPLVEGGDLDALVVNAGMIRGQHHALLGVPCQDFVGVTRTPDIIVAAQADGVGSVPCSHFGSELMSLWSQKTALELIRTPRDVGISVELLASLHDRLYERMDDLARATCLSPKAAHALFLAATLKLLIMTQRHTLIVGLDDGILSIGESVYRIEDLVPRNLLHERRKSPPLLSHCFKEDPHIGVWTRRIAEWAKVRGEQGFSPSPAEMAVRYEMALHGEALSLKVIHFGPTLLCADQGLLLGSDGFIDSRPDLSGRQGIHFSDIDGACGNVPSKTLAVLWNMASIPDYFAINDNTVSRTRLLADLPAAEEFLGRMRAFLGNGREALELNDRSIASIAFEALRSHSSRLADASPSDLIPLADDLSWVRVGR